MITRLKVGIGAMGIKVMGDTKMRRQEGFTMVELSISIAFIGILSITVVLIMADAISAYHRSMTLNDVNTVGTSLVDDMRLSVQTSSTKLLEDACRENKDIYKEITGRTMGCSESEVRKMTLVKREGLVNVGGSNINVPLYGALCTGTYSYIWNSGYFFSAEYGTTVNKATLYVDTGRISLNDFRLVKVQDKYREACVGMIDDTKLNAGEFRIQKSGDDEDGPVELLSDDDSSNLALYDLSTVVTEQNTNSGQAKNIYYYSSFILATVQGGININASGNYCATPEGANSEMEYLDYCAINKFNFAAMANGESKL